MRDFKMRNIIGLLGLAAFILAGIFTIAPNPPSAPPLSTQRLLHRTLVLHLGSYCLDTTVCVRPHREILSYNVDTNKSNNPFHPVCTSRMSYR